MAGRAQSRVSLPVAVTADAGVIEVRLSGEVDLAQAGALYAAAGSLNPRPGQTVLVDLTAATFVDSTVIAWLVGLADKAEAAGAQLVVTGAGGPVHRALHVSGVMEHLTVVGDDRPRAPLRLPARSP